jgi:hypothetical protein
VRTAWRPLPAIACGLLCTVSAIGQSLPSDQSFSATQDHPAVAYGTTPSNDAVVRLALELDSGTRRLDFEPGHGYLRSVLRALDIPESSQVANFSKASLQSPVISPANPRAIYFNDTTAVAAPSGGFIEVASQDARQGLAFYLLEQRASERPRFVRPASCLSCHLSHATLYVPGALVRSVATDDGGRSLPHIWNGTTSHRTPHAERWAGWYVTGRSGPVGHLGNTVWRRADTDARPAPSAMASLADRVGAGRTLTPHSDIAALLVFDHQMHGMNLLVRTGWEVRVAQADAPGAAAAVAARAAVDLVDYLLFIDEAPLAGPVEGQSGFAAAFASRGPRDRSGRSLRDLDLATRLLKHPCSYLVYSEAFDALPPAAKDAAYARLWHVLSGAERKTARYARLSRVDRQAIVDILRATKKEVPPYFLGAVL